MIDRLVRPYVLPGAHLLEIGCGSGNLLLQAIVPGVVPVALDLSRQALTFVHGRLSDLQARASYPQDFLLIQGIGEALPFCNASFDLILLSEVIEHLAAPQDVIREAARLLRPGGRLLVTTPNYRSLWPLLEWLVDRLNMAPKMAGEQHISRFDADSLRLLLEMAGLRIDYFGSIYLLAPFLALVSQSLAYRDLESELKSPPAAGMILAAVASKT
jgi:SAM-dependent methyltransferase